MTEFKTKLEEIQAEFKQEEHRTEKEFNIFNALYDKDKERFHSRFISYLLSPNSRHGAGNEFLKAFIQVISEHEHGEKLNTFDFNESIVKPNEKDKREYKDIDILIENRSKNQAIVIENKIYAKDSNHNNKPQGQQIQLNRYCKELENEGVTDIITIYLTLDRHSPERENKINYHPIKIDYHREIPNWIEKCIEITDNLILKEILEQYKSVISSITNNLDRVEKLKKLIDENIKEALNEREYIINKIDDFKHVQWHTIDEFWRELAVSLIDKLNVEIIKENDIKEITKVAHKGKGSTGINFKLDNGEEWYIVNNDKEGLTYGKILEDMSIKRKEGKDWFKLSENIKFTDFSNEETFKLINAKERGNKIDEIINTLKANPLLAGL